MAILELHLDSDVERGLKGVDRGIDRTSDKAEKLQRQFSSVDFKSFGKGFNLSKMFSGLDDLASAARSLFATVAAGFTAFTGINSELEQLEIMMTTVTGSVDAGQAAMQRMMDTATRMPYSVDSLADAFVKLQAAGVEDAEGMIKSFGDAIAAFGGGSEQLKLVTIAIQQMIGKTVISMEELRRQMGEQIPTAMRLMAKGLGMTIGELISVVETGKLEAFGAIEALQSEMDKLYSGAAERRMNSFLGATTLLKTEWIKLMKYIGDSNNLFNKITGTVKTLAEQLRTLYTSAEGQEKLRAMSENVAEFFDKIVQNPQIIKEFFDDVVRTAEYATRPIKNVYDMLVWIQATTDQMADLTMGQSLQGVGVNTDNLNSSNYIQLRDQLLEIRQLQEQLKEGGSGLGLINDDSPMGGFNRWFANLFSSDQEREVRDRIDALIYEVNDKLNNEVAPITITADKEKIKKTAAEIEAEVNSIAENLKPSLQKVSEAITESTIASAEATVKAYDGMVEEITDRLMDLETEIMDQKDRLVDLQKDLAEDMSDALRAGMSDEDAWKSQIEQIKEYQKQAQEAYKGGNLKEYNDLLERAYGLTKQLSTSGIEEPFDVNKLKQAAEEFNRISRITRGGKVAGDDQYEQALRKYNELLQQQKQGTSEIVSAQEQQNTKVELMKQLQSELIKSQEEKVDALVTEKEKYDEIERTVTTLQETTEQYKEAVDRGKEAVESLEQQWGQTAEQIESYIHGLTEDVKELVAEAAKFKLENTKGVRSTDSGSEYEERAIGGPVNAGQPYWVGEKGRRELFVPEASGNIIPEQQAMSGVRGEMTLTLETPGVGSVSLRGNRSEVNAWRRALSEQERSSSI